MSLFERYLRTRPRNSLFFGLTGSSKWNSQDLTAAVRRTFVVVGVTPPPSGKFKSHSLRIGSPDVGHTEQVLLSIPLEARMARFGWGSDSSSMANLYVERTIRPSAASFWVFSAWHATSAAASAPCPAG